MTHNSKAIAQKKLIKQHENQILRQKNSFCQIFKTVSDKYEQIQKEYRTLQKENDELVEKLDRVQHGKKKPTHKRNKSEDSNASARNALVGKVSASQSVVRVGNVKPTLTGFLEDRFDQNYSAMDKKIKDKFEGVLNHQLQIRMFR
jgi:hypothetical protein